jgi:NADH-quinone oxidoreductase subunit M
MIRFIFIALSVAFYYNFNHFEYVITDSVTLSFQKSALSNFFAYLSLGVIALVLCLKESQNYLLPLGALLYGLLFLFLAHDFLTLFIFWEVVAFSTLFILLKKSFDKSYILFSILSAMSLLVAILIHYHLNGTFSFVAPLSSDLALGFFIVAIITKSALFPMHHWLVATYKPSFDSFTIVLSALISKVAIFLAIIVVSLYGSLLALSLIALLGALFATFMAIKSNDAKTLLAYSSSAHIGYMLVGVGVGSSLAIAGVLYHVVVHALAKVILFANTRPSNLVARPISFVAVLIAVICLVGLPPLVGFSSKLLLYLALVDEPLTLALFIFVSTASFLYAFKYVNMAFLQQPKKITTARFNLVDIVPALVLFALSVAPSLLLLCINNVLSYLSFAPLKVDSIYTLNTEYGLYNGALILMLFVGVLVFIALLALLNHKSLSRPKNSLDIVYCAEKPKEALDYGTSIGNYIQNIKLLNAITHLHYTLNIDGYLLNIAQFIQRFLTIRYALIGIVIGFLLGVLL